MNRFLDILSRPRVPKGWLIHAHATTDARWNYGDGVVTVTGRGLFVEPCNHRHHSDRLNKYCGYHHPHPGERTDAKPIVVAVIMPEYGVSSADDDLVRRAYLDNYRQGENCIIPEGTRLHLVRELYEYGKTVKYYVPETLLGEWQRKPTETAPHKTAATTVTD